MIRKLLSGAIDISKTVASIGTTGLFIDRITKSDGSFPRAKIMRPPRVTQL